MNALDVMHFMGKGVPKDHKEAMAWFRKAAEAGNTDAMVNLGAMYEGGLGVGKDDRGAGIARLPRLETPTE